jgi:hypothetical protein
MAVARLAFSYEPSTKDAEYAAMPANAATSLRASGDAGPFLIG